jgi:hypothetical protein
VCVCVCVCVCVFVRGCYQNVHSSITSPAATGRTATTPRPFASLMRRTVARCWTKLTCGLCPGQPASMVLRPLVVGARPNCRRQSLLSQDAVDKSDGALAGGSVAKVTQISNFQERGGRSVVDRAKARSNSSSSPIGKYMIIEKVTPATGS